MDEKQELCACGQPLKSYRGKCEDCTMNVELPRGLGVGNMNVPVQEHQSRVIRKSFNSPS